MTNIEKVARAICIAMFGYDCVPNDGNLLAEPGSRLATVLRAAKAAIAAMQPAPQWYGIETAPRDGKAVLLWVPADDGWDAYVASGWYESGMFDRRWYAAVDENPLSPQPTHWMPLPTPPAGGSDEQNPA